MKLQAYSEVTEPQGGKMSRDGVRWRGKWRKWGNKLGRIEHNGASIKHAIAMYRLLFVPSNAFHLQKRREKKS